MLERRISNHSCSLEIFSIFVMLSSIKIEHFYNLLLILFWHFNSRSVYAQKNQWLWIETSQFSVEYYSHSFQFYGKLDIGMIYYGL